MKDFVSKARKDPKRARELFMEIYADFLKTLEQEPLDSHMVEAQATLMISLLPEETGDKIKNESNRTMAEVLQKAFESVTLEPVAFFKREIESCECAACQSLKIHHAN